MPFLPSYCVTGDKIELMNKKAIIQVKNLVAGYGDDIILDRISFDVYESEIFAVLGGQRQRKKHFA